MREEATHVTVALGSVYLCYSAFFVTIEISFLNLLVRVININIHQLFTHIVFDCNSVCGTRVPNDPELPS
jgi:hypothetical protein